MSYNFINFHKNYTFVLILEILYKLPRMFCQHKITMLKPYRILEPGLRGFFIAAILRSIEAPNTQVMNIYSSFMKI